MTILRNKTDVYKPYRHVPWCSLCMFIKGVHDVWLLTLQYWCYSERTSEPKEKHIPVFDIPEILNILFDCLMVFNATFNNISIIPYRHVPWCSLCMFIKGVHDAWLLTLQYWWTSFQHFKVYLNFGKYYPHIRIQNFVCGDRDFIILFCSLGGSISRNSGIQCFIMTILRNKMDVYKLYRHVPWCSLCMFIKGVHDVWLLNTHTAILMNFIPTFCYQNLSKII
jgi:hypothetical protein